MAKIHKQNIGGQLAALVYGGIEQGESREQWLTRLGASAIGGECRRAVWYGWRGFSHEVFDGRMLRLFETGHLQEARIIENLRQAGAEVWDRDEETGKQFAWEDGTGHFICKPDGVIRWAPLVPDPLVLEIKTHSDKSFTALIKDGVRVAKPEHVWQMQAGIALSNLGGALYVALNKNDENLYIEKVDRDDALIERIGQNKDAIVAATIPPSRISENQSLFSCAWCKHLDICAGREVGLRHCRTCVNSVAIENGMWACTKLGLVLDNDAQKAGCDEYYGY